MTTFAEATAVKETAPGVYAATIPDGWQQGKGAFGGVGVGVMARALLAHEAAAGRPLRSLSAELCAPALPVASELHVAVLRQGASMSFLDVRLLQEGALVGHATASVGKAREQKAVLAVRAGAAHQHTRRLECAGLAEKQHLVGRDRLVQRRAERLPVGQQLGKRLRVHHGAAQDVRAGLRAFL